MASLYLEYILFLFFFFQEMRYELAHLAHSCCDIDKFRVETCCVIGMMLSYDVANLRVFPVFV